MYGPLQGFGIERSDLFVAAPENEDSSVGIEDHARMRTDRFGQVG